MPQTASRGPPSPTGGRESPRKEGGLMSEEVAVLGGPSLSSSANISERPSCLWASPVCSQGHAEDGGAVNNCRVTAVKGGEDNKWMECAHLPKRGQKNPGAETNGREQEREEHLKVEVPEEGGGWPQEPGGGAAETGRGHPSSTPPGRTETDVSGWATRSASLFLITSILSTSSVWFSCSVVSDSLRPHGLQHTRPPCPSPTP